MVYESDFYTTRRPYTRPTVTSYSVTRRAVPWHLVPTVPRPSQVPPCYTAFGCKGFPDDEDDYLDYPYVRKIQPHHKNIPYIGHKRLVIVQPSAHGWRVKQSSLLGEIDRIYHKVRPSLSYQPKEDYLNSRPMVSFDDETRSIRAKTTEILKKIHTPVPRAQRPLPLPGEVVDEVLRLRHELANVAMKLISYPTTSVDYDPLDVDRFKNDRLYYSHTELPITERIISDNYIDRLLSNHRAASYPAPAVTQYEEPRTYTRLGKGHLACLTFAGGRPISRRRNLASVEDYIRDDINVLSHYSRFRQAAEKAPHVPDTVYGSIPHMPPSKSPITGSWKSNAPRRTQSDKYTTRITSDDDDTLERKKKRREQLEEEAVKEAEAERRRNEELKRQEELAEQAAAERQAELDRKAQQEEEERIIKEEAERMEALRQEEEERKAKEEEEARLAKEEEERKAKEAEAKKKAKEEAARKAEEERKAREEEERRIKEEQERQAREEEERRLKEEEEQRQKEEEERLAREEEERRLKEEEERKAEEERLAREEEEKQKAETEGNAEEEEEQGDDEEKQEEPEVEEPAKNQPEEVTEPEPAEEEAGNEPLVEEPMSPEVAPAKMPGDEEDGAEEEEEEEEEEDE